MKILPRIFQRIKTKSVMNSIINQASGDIKNNYYFVGEIPEDIKSKLQSREQFMILAGAGLESSQTHESPDIYSKLLEKHLDSISNYISSGRTHVAMDLLDDLLSAAGFPNLAAVVQANIFFLRGLVELELNPESEEIDLWHQKILSTRELTEQAYDLVVKKAIFTNDDHRYRQLIQTIEARGLSEQFITVSRCRYELQHGNEDFVIAALMGFDSIKSNYEQNPDALFYLGAALMQQGKCSTAKSYFEKANRLKESVYREYLCVLCDVVPMLDKPGAIHLMTPDKVAFMENKLKVLETFRAYFSEKPSVVQSEYWGHVLNVLLFIDPKRVVSEVETLSSDVRDSNLVQLMLAEAHSLLGANHAATSIYSTLYTQQKNPQLLIKILLQMLMRQDYPSVVEFLETMPLSEFDDEGVVAGIFIEALSKVKSWDATVQQLRVLEVNFPTAVVFLQSVSIVFFEKNQMEEATTYIKRAISLIDGDENAFRLGVAETCERLGLVSEAIDVLRPLEPHSIVARKYLVSLALRLDTKQARELGESITDREIQDQTSELFVYNAKAEFCIKDGRLDDALKSLTESYRRSPDIYSAYNILALKIRLNYPTDMAPYVSYLLSTGRPKAVMMAAVASDFTKDRRAAEAYAYRSVHLLGDEFDEDMYLQYILLNSPPKQSHQVIVDFHTVQPDTVVELMDTSGTKKLVCLDSEIDLLNADRETSSGAEHYIVSSATAIRLLGMHGGSQVSLYGVIYTIQGVVNKYAHVYRYCLDRYIKLRPDSSALFAIDISVQDPIFQLLPLLQQQNARHRFLMEQYNFSNGLGLPIFALSDTDHAKYPDVIARIYNLPDQLFYAGQCVEIALKQNRVVLTMSSLITFKLIGKLDVLCTHANNIYVPNSLYEAIKAVFEKTLAYNTELGGGLLGLTDDGVPIYTPITASEQQQRVAFWREILVAMEHMHKQAVHSDLPDISQAGFIAVDDIDAMVLNRQLGAVLLCDDLAIVRIANLVFPETISTNTAGVLLGTDSSNPDYLDIILLLSKVKYVQACTKDVLMHLVHDFVINSHVMFGQGTNYDKLIQVVRNLLSLPVLFDNYVPVIRDTMVQLYSEGRLNTRISSIMEAIVKELKMAARAYKRDLGSLEKFLIEPCGIDVVMENFFRSSFSQ